MPNMKTERRWKVIMHTRGDTDKVQQETHLAGDFDSPEAVRTFVLKHWHHMVFERAEDVTPPEPETAP